MRGHKVIVGDWWVTSLEGEEGTYLFQILAIVKQRRRVYVVAAKVDASDEAIDAGKFGELTLEEIDLCWFGADGWQINPVMEAFRLLRPDRPMAALDNRAA
jgi:hypothetical protein